MTRAFIVDSSKVKRTQVDWGQYGAGIRLAETMVYATKMRHHTIRRDLYGPSAVPHKELDSAFRWHRKEFHRDLMLPHCAPRYRM